MNISKKIYNKYYKIFVCLRTILNKKVDEINKNVMYQILVIILSLFILQSKYDFWQI